MKEVEHNSHHPGNQTALEVEAQDRQVGTKEEGMKMSIITGRGTGTARAEAIAEASMGINDWEKVI